MYVSVSVCKCLNVFSVCVSVVVSEFCLCVNVIARLCVYSKLSWFSMEWRTSQQMCILRRNKIMTQPPLHPHPTGFQKAREKRGKDKRKGKKERQHLQFDSDISVIWRVEGGSGRMGDLEGIKQIWIRPCPTLCVLPVNNRETCGGR